MSDIRAQFRDFLLRFAENNQRVDDWSTFAIQHYPDEELETLRQTLVKRSLDFPDWQIGWIPRPLQDTARDLAEYLRDVAEDTITYWTEWSEITDDGTIHIKVTWFDDTSHSSGRCDISTAHPNYEFWKWLLSDEEPRAGRNKQSGARRTQDAVRRSRTHG